MVVVIANVIAAIWSSRNALKVAFKQILTLNRMLTHLYAIIFMSFQCWLRSKLRFQFFCLLSVDGGCFQTHKWSEVTVKIEQFGMFKQTFKFKRSKNLSVKFFCIEFLGPVSKIHYVLKSTFSFLFDCKIFF